MYDVIILTDSRYINPSKKNWYIKQVLLEDNLLKNALEKKRLIYSGDPEAMRDYINVLDAAKACVEVLKNKTNIGIKIEQIINEGGFVTDSIINDLLKKVIYLFV